MNDQLDIEVEPELHAWLQEQAAAHSVSIEEEVRALLRSARGEAEARRREVGRAASEAPSSTSSAPTQPSREPY